MTSINREKALELLEGNEELYQHVVSVFLQDTPLQLSKLQMAFENGEMSVAARLAHAIKSAAGSVGAETLSDQCFRLERIAKELEGEACATVLLAVTDEFQKVKILLEGILSSPYAG